MRDKPKYRPRKWLPLEQWKDQHRIKESKPLTTRRKRDLPEYGSVQSMPERLGAMPDAENLAESLGTASGARASKPFHREQFNHEPADDGKPVA